jgi:hypothetical protein
LTAEAPAGTRRIDADDDLVKQEVAAALGRSDVTVVPVLVEGASMPTAVELPREIASLAKFNAFDLTNKRWKYDVEQLTQLARRHDKWWWRLVLRTPRLALRIAPIVALAVAGVVVVAVANSGPDKAARIASCERTHGLAAARVTRPPRSGEAQFSKSAVTPPVGFAPEFTQTTYASCNWPPARGADADGYGAVTVTQTNGPGTSDASDRDFADVIESQCKRIGLHYTYELMGDQIPFTPFVASPGGIWAPGPPASPASAARTYSFMHLTELGSSAQAPLRLPFYPPARAVVVLHGQQVLQRAACVD